MGTIAVMFEVMRGLIHHHATVYSRFYHKIAKLTGSLSLYNANLGVSLLRMSNLSPQLCNALSCPCGKENRALLSAKRFMQVAEKFGQIPHRAEFSDRALYLLSTSKVPETVVQEVLSGEVI